MKLSIGFSPCPNDTFIFDQMIHSSETEIEWDVKMEDVETLNQWAFAGKLDVTKLSFATYLKVKNKYDLLCSGAALGKGVGPILVSKEPIREQNNFETISKLLNRFRIAIPGKYTTANLLLKSAFPNANNKEEVLFSEIEAKVLSGGFDAGLLIHENRFTYQQKGLHKIIDLGEWWEQTHHAPIPLGGIVIRKELSAEWKTIIEKMIQDSLQNSWNQYPQLSEFVRNHAQEMEEAVMRSHIELYVNEETMELSSDGLKAVEVLARANELV